MLTHEMIVGLQRYMTMAGLTLPAFLAELKATFGGEDPGEDEEKPKPSDRALSEFELGEMAGMRKDYLTNQLDPQSVDRFIGLMDRDVASRIKRSPTVAS